MLDRRTFLNRSAVISAAMAALRGTPLAADQPKPAPAKRSPGEMLQVAVVGCGGRGGSHIKEFNGNFNCRIATLCDVDSSHVASGMKAVAKVNGKAPKFEQDIRKVLDDKAIDIVSIATPNHWHALAAIWAMQAGKDVYVEKPVSHNVSEGRRIVEAARKYNRICQAGTQSRSHAGHARGDRRSCTPASSARSSWPRGLCYKPRGSIGKVDGRQRRPDDDRLRPLVRPGPEAAAATRKQLHYDWHWIWDYGNGDLGNQGIHQMDKARWGLGKNDAAERRRQPRRPVRLRRRRRDRQHADRRLRLRRRAADLRGPRPARPTTYKGVEGRQHLLRHRRLRRLPELQQRRRLRPGRQGWSRSSSGGGDQTTSATSSRPSAAASART